MDPVTAGAIALATLLLNKSVEKTGEILAEKAFEQGGKVMKLLKRKSPETASELEGRQHEADYPGGICWLNARDSNLAAEIVQFAQRYMNLEVPQKRGETPLNLKQQVEWCWQNWYTPPSPPW